MEASCSSLHTWRKIQSADEVFKLRRERANSIAKTRSEGEMQRVDPGTFVLPQAWLPQC
jgi:hypothetical protein